MTRAIERHKTGDVQVVPIILRPANWDGAPFAKLQMLPTGGIPVTKWANRDEAFLDISKGISKIIGRLQNNPE